jgi:alpha-beta hydrolase superfamily lysophospholipase
VETDLLGEPFERQTIELGSDDEGPVVATLVRRRATTPTTRAVLYVHGFVDYFFQTHLAEFYNANGWHFYAIDLRKHGRSLREYQTPNFCADIEEYFADYDAAIKIIREEDGNSTVLLNGHSTGGLSAALWAHRHRSDNLVDGLFLNSPFFDLNAPAFTRNVVAPAASGYARLRPKAALPQGLSEAYGKSIHSSFHGEWNFDLAWKPVPGFPVRAGWLRAIRAAQARVHAGLDIPVPVLVGCSLRSYKRGTYAPAAHYADAVLDVADIVRWTPTLGRHVTLVRVDGGLHDLTLSEAPVRERVFAEVKRWMDTYVGVAAATNA